MSRATLNPPCNRPGESPDPKSDDSAILIRRHYREIGVMPGWNVARFKRVCAMLHVTPNELGAMAALTLQDVKLMMKRDKFTAAASLQFALIEAAILEQRIGRPQPEIVPFSKLSAKRPE